MEYLGYVGTLSFLFLYYMSGLTKRWSLDHWQYHTTVLVGSVIFFVYGWWLEAWPVVLLEVFGITLVLAWYVGRYRGKVRSVASHTQNQTPVVPLEHPST